MAYNDIGFAENFQYLFMIDTTPTGTVRTWARIGAGISKVKPDGNEETSSDAWFDGDGYKSTEVTGAQTSYDFSGSRKYGDPAQDYVASIRGTLGTGRKTSLRVIAPNGDIEQAAVTITDITPGGSGKANDKADFEFKANYDGAPTFTIGAATTFPTSITATDASVKVGASAPIVATIAPAGASPALVYGIDDDTVATVDAAGNVTGVKVGTANVCVKSVAKPSVTKIVKVTVTTA